MMRKLIDIVEDAGAGLRRFHHSPKKLAQRLGAGDYDVGVSRKPDGFWWAFGSTWKDFLDGGGFAHKKLGRHRYAVDLGAANARVLALRDWQDILDFTVRFGTTYADGPEKFHRQRPGTRDRYDPEQDEHLRTINVCMVPAIDWRKAREEFDGIEIPGFRKGDPSRPRVEWLDTDWDVPSGCAWNVGAIRQAPAPLPKEGA